MKSLNVPPLPILMPPRASLSRSRTPSRQCRTAAFSSNLINAPFLAAGGSGEQFRAGIQRAVALGWLWRHESGTYLKFTDSGAASAKWVLPACAVC
jgi:hypothetical protein